MIKAFISILVLLICTKETAAKCATGALSVWPENTTILAGSFFMIEGYGELQDVVKKLGKEFKISLVSGYDTVPCFQTGFYKGQFELDQIFLTPQKDLKVGNEYKFHSPKLAQWFEIQDNRKLFLWQDFSKIWKIKVGKDKNVPVWSKPPLFLKGTFLEAGCGPEANAIFSFSATDNSPILIKTLVRRAASGSEVIYYLQAIQDHISVGNAMCSGAFDFRWGKNDFEVEFTLVDASGNETPWKGPPIKFQSPYKSGN